MVSVLNEIVSGVRFGLENVEREVGSTRTLQRTLASLEFKFKLWHGGACDIQAARGVHFAFFMRIMRASSCAKAIVAVFSTGIVLTKLQASGFCIEGEGWRCADEQHGGDLAWILEA